MNGFDIFEIFVALFMLGLVLYTIYRMEQSDKNNPIKKCD